MVSFTRNIEGDIDGKGHEGIFWGDVKVLDIILDGSYTVHNNC